MKSLGAVASLVLIGVGLYVGYRLFSPALAPVLPGKCTVGYAGTHLQVTVEGIGAVAACNRAEQETSNWYQVDGSASGTLVCRQTLGRLTYTVWDEGMFMVYGNSECQNLENQGLTTPQPGAS